DPRDDVSPPPRPGCYTGNSTYYKVQLASETSQLPLKRRCQLQLLVSWHQRSSCTCRPGSSNNPRTAIQVVVPSFAFGAAVLHRTLDTSRRSSSGFERIGHA